MGVRTITLANLRTACKQRADMENSAFISDSEWTRMIDTVWAELWELLVASGDPPVITEQTINATGATTYALPDDHFSTIGIDYDSTDLKYTLRELMIQERRWAETVTGAARAVAFLIQSNAIKLRPNPPSGTYKHIYVPMPVDLTVQADGYAVQFYQPAAEDFVIWGVVRMARAKEESDTTHAEREFERARQRVEEIALMRKLTQPRRRQVDTWGPDYLDTDPADW